MTAVLTNDLRKPQPERAPRRRRLSDTGIYVLLALLTASAWQISQMGWFRAGDDLGYWLGFSGGTMLLLLFIYPLRKHFRFAFGWGRMSIWLWLHMALGVGGSWLILVHSTFRVGSLNAAVALYSMLIVALSGVVGRFIHRHVNKGLRGEEVSLKELQTFAGLHKTDAHSGLAFAPTVQERLKAFEQSELGQRKSWLGQLRCVMWLPTVRRRELRLCRTELVRRLHATASAQGWTPEYYARQHRKAVKLVRSYLDAVVGVAQYTAYERLFALWHVAHIPFVYLLIVSAIVHVIAVHAY